jgi:hypothetical protein
MAYDKTVWVDEILAGDAKYQVKNDDGDVIYSEAEISLSTGVATAGTPVTAAAMNKIEDKLEELDAAGSVPDASDTVKGKVELATAAETSAGTDATRAVTPDSLAGSGYGKRTIVFRMNGSVALTTNEKAYFRVPDWMNGWKLVKPSAMCKGTSSSGVPQFTLKNGATSMLTTNITIDAGEDDSKDAAAPPVIDTSHDTVAEGDHLEAGTAAAGTGVTYASVNATFQAP